MFHGGGVAKVLPRLPAVFGIRIHMFLGLPDPDPDPLVRCMDPDWDPDPYIINKKGKKNLDSYCFVTPFGLFIFAK